MRAKRRTRTNKDKTLMELLLSDLARILFYLASSSNDRRDTDDDNNQSVIFSTLFIRDSVAALLLLISRICFSILNLYHPSSYTSHAYIRLLCGTSLPRTYTHSLYSHSHSLYCNSAIPLYRFSTHHASFFIKSVRLESCVARLLCPSSLREVHQYDLQSGTPGRVHSTSGQECITFQRILALVRTTQYAYMRALTGLVFY